MLNATFKSSNFPSIIPAHICVPWNILAGNSDHCILIFAIVWLFLTYLELIPASNTKYQMNFKFFFYNNGYRIWKERKLV